VEAELVKGHPNKPAMKLELSCSLGVSRPLTVPFTGPLDAYASGLAFAVLPFRGLASYTGACCRVRDAGDSDAEQDEVFDVAGEPVFPTLVGAGGGGRWYDQSGNGNDMLQSSAASQPTLTPNVVNGYQTMRFDGVNDKMGVEVGSFTAMTLYIVARQIAPTSNGRLLELSEGFSSSIFLDGSGDYGYYFTSPDIAPVGGPASVWSVIVLKCPDSSNATPYVNGVAGTSFLLFGGTDRFFINLCASSGGEYGNFDVAAALRWDVAHDDTTRESIQTLLASKFGITL